MSKIEEIKKIKQQIEEALKGVDVPGGATFQEVFYKLYNDWVKMKGEWEQEQENRRRELEEKFKKSKDLEKECEEVERAYCEVEEAIDRKVQSLSGEIEMSSNNLHGLRSAYQKAYRLNPNLCEFADEDKQALDDIDEGIVAKRNLLKMLKGLPRVSKGTSSERGEE